MAGPDLFFLLLGSFFFFFFFNISGARCRSLGLTASMSVHELLQAHGLPGGLVPKAVASYKLDEKTGLLDVKLERPCYVKYDADLALFQENVRGNLTFGALRGVEGLSQEELFVWFPVKGIVVSDPGSGVILFDIGFAHKHLPRSVFEEPPDCTPGSSAGSIVAPNLVGRWTGIKEAWGREESNMREGDSSEQEWLVGTS